MVAAKESPRVEAVPVRTPPTIGHGIAGTAPGFPNRRFQHHQGRAESSCRAEERRGRKPHGGNAPRWRHPFPPPPLPAPPIYHHQAHSPPPPPPPPPPLPPIKNPRSRTDDDARHQRHRHSRGRPRPRTAQGGGDPLSDADADAAQGEAAVGQRRAAVARLRAGGRLRPLQRGGRRGAGPRQGARRHRPQRRRPARHLRAHRAAVGAGVEARDRRWRGGGGRRLPGPRRRRPLQPLGRRLPRQARGPGRAAGRRADRHAGGRRGGRPRRHRPGRGRLRVHRRLN